MKISLHLLAFVFALYCAQVLAAADNKMSRDEMRKMDAAESDYSKILCLRMKSACEVIKETCGASPMPNICLMVSLFIYEMDAENCISKKRAECADSRMKYQNKVHDFIREYYDDMGAGRIAVNVCMPFHKISPKNQLILELSERINNITEGLGDYYDYEGYYSCIEKQYTGMAKDILP